MEISIYKSRFFLKNEYENEKKNQNIGYFKK